MGRMLETMKHGEVRRVLPSVKKPAEQAAVQEGVADWEIDAEVPFIEVGGPNKKVELSPGLLAPAALSLPRPVPQSVESAPAVVKPATVQLTAAKPMAVAYEAYPSVAAAPTNISAEIIAYHQPDHPTSKEYARLLHTMLQGVTGKKPSVLLFVGHGPNTGASTVIVNLAVIAAQQKTRVALIEASTKNAGLAPRLGYAGRTGLDEILAGTLGLEQALVKTAIPPLHLLPAGVKEMPINAEAMSWLHAWLRPRYDLVLIDGPTLDDSAALAAHVPHAHGIYLVLPQGVSASEEMARSIDRLGGRLCGVIHTHFEM